MNHQWNDATYRCSACGVRWSPATAGFPCHPDDGATFVASLGDGGERPADTKAEDGERGSPGAPARG